MIHADLFQAAFFHAAFFQAAGLPQQALQPAPMRWLVAALNFGRPAAWWYLGAVLALAAVSVVLPLVLGGGRR